MITRGKNGKHYTIYINRLITVFIAVLLCIPSLSTYCQQGKNEWVIVIDPGHGGKDPGAVGSMSYEKNIVLAVALKMGEYLGQNSKNVKLIYTRKTDQYVDLNERAEIANRNNADLFISIHANAFKNKNSYGSETYVMGHAKDQLNLEVAMKENEVMILDNNSAKYEGFDPKSPESYIMFTLMQNAFYEQSVDLATRIQAEVKSTGKLYNRGVSPGPFWVLWKTTMPSVLFEMGFITNPNDEKYIASKQGQDDLAKSLARACISYMAEIEKKSIISTAADQQVTAKPDTEKIVNTGDNTAIYYMVQVSASPKKVQIKPANFKKLTDIVEIYSGNRYRYASGKFTEYDKAVAYRKKLETLYPDAFVIAVKDNKIIPLQETLDKNRNRSK